MKLKWFVMLALLFVFFSGCGRLLSQEDQITDPTVAPLMTLETTIPPAEETTPPTTESTNSYVLPGVSVEDIISYFSEVCLDAEIVNSGDPSVLQKWDTPIYYALHGAYTQTDSEVLMELIQWLNVVNGFPGMYPATDPLSANLHIYFGTQQEMLSAMGDDFADMDGAVTFWYEENIIYSAEIYIRTDLHQSLRNSVILEEIYNGLGPIQDTNLREDSVIFSGYSEPQDLTDMDKLILELLYHPKMRCGMDAEQCEQVIRELYE